MTDHPTRLEGAAAGSRELDVRSVLGVLDPDTLELAADQCQRSGLNAVSTALRMMATNQRDIIRAHAEQVQG